MSELKVRFIDDTYVEYYNTGKHDLAQVYIKAEVDASIAELKAENQRLKKCEIWMKQHFFCEEVIACESAKNRRLKRALWLARAEKFVLRLPCPHPQGDGEQHREGGEGKSRGKARPMG